MPNICYVINTLQPAGAENQLLNIIKNAPSEFDFTIAHFGWELSLKEDLEDAGASLLNLDFSYPYDIKGILELITYCRGKIDLIHSHLPSSILIGRIVSSLLDIPHVSSHHNVPENYSLFSRLLELFTRPSDDVTIAVSEGVENTHTHLPGDNWKVIYNGIDVDGYRDHVEESNPTQIRKRLNINSDTVYLNIARYSPQKRQVDLVRAMDQVVKQTKSAHLILVGWGEDKSKIRSAVENQGVKDFVTITGRVPEVYPYYAIADVFVSASTREGLPITFIEAMAAGLPIIATDIPGTREMVDDSETGWLVPPKNPTELAQTMLDVEVNYNIEHRGMKGTQRAKEMFDIDTTIKQHVELYHQLLCD